MRAQPTAGFTLIEVLLATAIFAVISLASFSILDGVIRTKNGAEAKQQRLYEIQRAWLVIERDLLQIARRSVRIEGESPQTDFFYADNGDLTLADQAIAFVRAGWTNPNLLLPRGDLQPVAYRVNEGTLERLHFNFVDPVVGEAPIIRKLVTNITDLQIKYFMENKWQESLSLNAWPQAIELTLVTEDLGTLSRKFLIPEQPFTTQQSSSNDNTSGAQQNTTESLQGSEQ